MVKTGEAQAAYSITAGDSKTVPKSVPQSSFETILVRLNTEHPILKDVRIRQALAGCIDRQAIADKLFDGYATPASQMVAHTIMGYNPDLKPYAYDVAKAKGLIKEAGYAGQELKYYDYVAGITGTEKFTKPSSTTSAIVAST